MKFEVFKQKVENWAEVRGIYEQSTENKQETSKIINEVTSDPTTKPTTIRITVPTAKEVTNSHGKPSTYALITSRLTTGKSIFHYWTLY